jgi:choline dehydrogenase-like flavoprotein
MWRVKHVEGLLKKEVSIMSGSNIFVNFFVNTFLKSKINGLVKNRKEAAKVLHEIKNNKIIREVVTGQVKEIKKTFKTFKFRDNLLDLGEDLEDLIRHLSQDTKNALKHFETVLSLIVKFVFSFGNYAFTKKKWEEIGYYGPRPKGKVFEPPEEIVEKGIAMMGCPKMPGKRQIGKDCQDPEDPFQKNPFHNCQYEKQMEETNKLLKDNIKDINEYPDNDEVDICIIGTGPGGGALAYTLNSKLKEKKIVILEQGDLFTSDEFNQMEKDMVPALYHTRFTDDFGIGFNQARMVGGSAVISDALCFELPKEAAKTWDRDVADDLEKGNYYEKVDEMIHYKKIAKTALNKNAWMFQEGVKKIGKEEFFHPMARNTHPEIDSRSAAHQLSCTGCGFCFIGCKYNRKLTPQITYIPAVIKNGVRVFKNATVSEVLYEKKNGKEKVKGVRVERGTGKADLIIKAKMVVVSCGAVNSTQLLLKSGIKNPHLGKNIGLHPAAQVYGVFNEDIYGDWGIIMCASYHEFQFPKDNPEIFPDGYGYLIETVFNHPAVTAATFPLPVNKIKKRMKDYKKMAKVGIMLRDSSLGEIKKRHGVMTPLHYKLTEMDKAKLRHGIRTAANIFLEAGAKEVFTNHDKELLFREKEDLKKADSCSMEPGDILLASSHPQGGCKMGNPGNGVVDFNGHSYDVNNLFVCDASLFPTALGVNPKLTIMAVATKIGEHIAAEINKYI